MNINGIGGPVTIRNVYFTPGLRTSLLSMSQLMEYNYKLEFSTKYCYISDEMGESIAVGIENGGLYKLEEMKKMNTALLTKVEQRLINAELWHRRLGHPGYRSMRFVRELVPDLYIPKKRCPICIKSKHAKKPFIANGQGKTEPLELVHTDLWGPREASLGGHRYLLTIIDDFSRKVFAYPQAKGGI